MTRDQFIYGLTACGCLLKDGKTWYEHNELIKCFEDMGLFEQEPQIFKWCTDCKEYDQEKHCCHRWSKVIRDTVEEMKQAQEPYHCDTCKHNNDPWYTEPCDSCCGSDGYEKKYIEREVLDRIKAKIEQSRYGLDDGLDLALNIIDECIAESEDT